MGWDNGELLIWNSVDGELFEGLPLHKTPITVLEWSSNGTRLTSGDKVYHMKVEECSMTISES